MNSKNASLIEQLDLEQEERKVPHHKQDSFAHGRSQKDASL